MSSRVDRVTAVATPSGGWWAVEVAVIPGLLTQARVIGDVESQVREAANALGVEVAEVDVVVADRETAEETQRS